MGSNELRSSVWKQAGSMPRNGPGLSFSRSLLILETICTDFSPVALCAGRVYFLISTVWFASINKQQHVQHALIEDSFGVFILFVLIFSGCGKTDSTLNNINTEEWKGDRNACGTYRVTAALHHGNPKKTVDRRKCRLLNCWVLRSKWTLQEKSKVLLLLSETRPDCPNYDPVNSTRLAILV